MAGNRGRWEQHTLQKAIRGSACDHDLHPAFPNGDFDRYGAVRAEGWRCQVASVTESGAPPNYRP